MIRKAKASEISKIIALTQACAAVMEANGIFQWNKYYPSAVAFENDIARDELYVYLTNATIVGSITISTYKDEEYKPIQWLTKESQHYYIHRLAVHPTFQGQGIAQQLMTFAENTARAKGIASIRLDTFSKNERNQRFYSLRGYQKVGQIYFPKQSKAPFYCYELVL